MKVLANYFHHICGGKNLFPPKYLSPLPYEKTVISSFSTWVVLNFSDSNNQVKVLKNKITAFSGETSLWRNLESPTDTSWIDRFQRTEVWWCSILTYSTFGSIYIYVYIYIIFIWVVYTHICIADIYIYIFIKFIHVYIGWP